MVDAENVINGQLRSAHAEDVRHGLANILYWGYANVGDRDTRVADLNGNIAMGQIQAFQTLVANSCAPTMAEIKTIRIPQYSGMSFLSKVLMFLNPMEYCVLDKQICPPTNRELTTSPQPAIFRAKGDANQSLRSQRGRL